MPPPIALLGTLDTKGAEYGFLARCLRVRARPLLASGMDARRVKTRDAGLQLRRQPGSGGRRPTHRKTLKFTLSLPDVQCL
jgi:hypothetical protein